MTFITLAQVGLTDKGPRYSVTLDGEIIVKSARDPEHDAARVLRGRGITGRATTLGPTGKARMTFDIEKFADTYVDEHRETGLRVRKFTEHPAPLSR